MDESFDVVVIGAGPAGENAADYAVRGSGRTAALVEAGLVGGECSYYACMPSKALLRPIEVRGAAEHLAGLPDAVPLDREALLRRRDSWVSHYDDGGQVRWAEGAGLTVVRGRGRLVGDRVVEVATSEGTRTLTARQAVVIATGSVPVLPESFAGVHPWGSRDATGVLEVPDSLVVIGGGVVACEAATWMAALGSRVTMLVRGGRLLERFEPFAGEHVADRLREAGVDVRTGVSVTDAQRVDAEDRGIGRIHGGEVTLELSAGAAITVDEVLVATGRRPALGDLGLETVGVQVDARTGRIDGELPPWLSRVGDASGEAALTHWGKYEGRLAGLRLAAEAEGRTAPAQPKHVAVPQVVFTDPQVASVGLTAAQAEQAGHAVTVLDQPMSAAAGASLLRDDMTGQARLVVDSAADTLLGATFVGTDVADLVHAATVAIVGQVPLSVLDHAVPSYPTSSEIWLRLLETRRG